MTLAGARRLLGRGHSLAPPWRRPLPRHAASLAICALALLLGIAVADDYGVWLDTFAQRTIGEATLRHLAGENGLNLLWPPTDRLYGPVFELPLRLVERILYPVDGRGVYLCRHLLTHLFHLIGGFAGYLLAYRLFGSRWLALFALLLFLLHPRIYAHSFFNSKDVPFLGLFMICLWLAHRAFGKGSAGAFALCGVAAGLLTNLRVMGLVFVAAVVFLRVFDIVAAGHRDERRRAIASCATFALASIAAFYATMPYLWADPVTRFVEIVRVMSAHPTDKLQLFQGDWLPGSELPPSYLPVWFGITTPPLALLLGATGLAALAWRTAAGLFPSSGVPRNPLRTPLRFELLVAACFVVPLLVAIVLRPTLYNDWRHFYFLWGPFVLLATSGLRALIAGARNAPRHLGPWRLPTTVAGLAALGLGAISVEMARLHPHQHLYFNVLADRPGTALPLRQRFRVVDWFGRSRGYAYILEDIAERERLDAVFNVRLRQYQRKEHEPARRGITRPKKDLGLFRQRDQRRFKFDPNADPDFYVRGREHVLGSPGTRFPPLLYERRLYGQPIAQVATPDLSRVNEATAAPYRALYRDVTSSAPALRGDIDVYRGETAITWVKETCAPGDLNRAMGMTVVPLDAARVRDTLRVDGVRVGDACLWQVPLPDYPVAKMLFHDIGALASDAYLEERRRRYAALAATRPAARSTFDVYLQNGTLLYVKTPCVPADTEAPFFVHVRPVHLGDIPRSRHQRRRIGFDSLDFRFGSVNPHSHYAPGDIFDGVCMATLDLPDYPIASIGTGQYIPGGASLWRADVDGRLPTKRH